MFSLRWKQLFHIYSFQQRSQGLYMYPKTNKGFPLGKFITLGLWKFWWSVRHTSSCLKMHVDKLYTWGASQWNFLKQCPPFPWEMLQCFITYNLLRMICLKYAQFWIWKQVHEFLLSLFTCDIVSLMGKVVNVRGL